MENRKEKRRSFEDFLRRSNSLSFINSRRHSLSDQGSLVKEESKSDTSSKHASVKSLKPVLSLKMEADLKKHIKNLLEVKILQSPESKPKKSLKKETTQKSKNESDVTRSPQDRILDEQVDAAINYESSSEHLRLKAQQEQMGNSLGIVKAIFFEFYLADQALPDYIKRSDLIEILQKFPSVFQEFSINPKFCERLGLNEKDAEESPIFKEILSKTNEILQDQSTKNFELYKIEPNLCASIAVLCIFEEQMREALSSKKEAPSKELSKADESHPAIVFRELMGLKSSTDLALLAEYRKAKQELEKNLHRFRVKSQDDVRTVITEIMALSLQVKELLFTNDSSSEERILELNKLLDEYLVKVQSKLQQFNLTKTEQAVSEKKLGQKEGFFKNFGKKLKSKQNNHQDIRNLETLNNRLQALKQAIDSLQRKLYKKEKTTPDLRF